MSSSVSVGDAPSTPGSPTTRETKRRKIDVDLSQASSPAHELLASSPADTDAEADTDATLEESKEGHRHANGNGHKRIDPDTMIDDGPHTNSNHNATAAAASSSSSSSSSTVRGGRLSRKAKSDANQRVTALALTLQDTNETTGLPLKRKSITNRKSTSKKKRSHDQLLDTQQTQTRRATKEKDESVMEQDDDSDDVQIIEDIFEEEEVEDDIEIDGGDDGAVDGAVATSSSSSSIMKRTGKRAGVGAAASASLDRKQVATKHTTKMSTRPRPVPTAAAASSSSSSSSAAAAASASSSSSSTPAPAKKQRDLRRDKRISGFGPWKVVHKSSIPAMTYEGYEDLATETLEKETQAAVRKSQVYSPQGVDSYHRDPSDIITGKAEMPLTLMRRVDTKYGREEYKVRAMRTIEKKEVVAFLGGRLMEAVKANKQMREEWNQHFHMKKEWLKEYFEYDGTHDLVISTKDHKSIGSYIRSPEMRDDDGDGANLKADVIFDPRSGLFIVIYYATERIRRGQEVFCMPFLGDFHDRCHREMFLFSRISHWHHKWVARMEEKLLAAGIKFDTSVPAKMHSIILTADQEEKFLNIPGLDQGALPEPLPIDQSMIIVNIDDAMQYCESVGDFIPDYLEIKGPIEGEYDDDGEQVIGVRKYRVDRDEVLALIESGFRAECLELREELGIHSPVRHFTPPNYRAFCVVATSFIPKGTFVFAYSGEITEEVVHRDSAYVYIMEREQIRRTVRSYHGPDLALDALKVGNIARFVNDSMYRMGEADEKGATANLETQFLFVKGTIHLGFYTTRDVNVKEELVSQYGEDYWKAINKQLIDEHKKFYDYINPYSRKLEGILHRHKIPLPQPPPDDWQCESEELFRAKPMPYPILANRDSDAEDGHEVERILQMRTDSEGRVEYLVKWKHSSSSNNSWIKAKQIIDCVDLIAEFKAAEANKRANRGKKTGGGKKSTTKK